MTGRITAPHYRRSSARGMIGFGALLIASGVLAQNATLDEIVVTAQKREQPQQEVPIAVSVLWCQRGRRALAERPRFSRDTARRGCRMNSRLISGTVSGGDLSATCLSCNPTTTNRRRETREFGVQPTMQAQPLEDYL